MTSYSEAELKEYSQCLEIKFTGGHTAGLASCPFCAQIYRRHHQEVLRPAPSKQTEEETGVCECCEGRPTNCLTPSCAEFGVCFSCSVGDK